MIKPIGDKVVIEPLKKSFFTASGIILPDFDKTQSQEGVVVAIGSTTTGDVKPGDRVHYSKYAGFDASYEGVDYLIIPEDEIEAILRD